MEQIFVSSVQKELQADRYAVRDFVHGNALLGQFFRVFLFEDLPPTDRRADEVYLDTACHRPRKSSISPPNSAKGGLFSFGDMTTRNAIPR